MVSELLSKVITVHNICIEAYTHFYRAINFGATVAALRKKRAYAVIIVLLSLLTSVGIFQETMPEIPQRISQENLTFARIFQEKYSDIFFHCILLLITVVVFFSFLLRIILLSKKVGQYVNKRQSEIVLGQKVFANNIDGLSVLPEDYCNLKATTYILEVVRSGRAQSINEALNMFDTYLHRKNMEDTSQQILLMQQQQTAYLKSIKTRSGISAMASVGTFIKLK